MQLENESALGLSNEKLPQQIKVPLQKHSLENEPAFAAYSLFSIQKKLSTRCDELWRIQEHRERCPNYTALNLGRSHLPPHNSDCYICYDSRSHQPIVRQWKRHFAKWAYKQLSNSLWPSWPQLFVLSCSYQTKDFLVNVFQQNSIVPTEPIMPELTLA